MKELIFVGLGSFVGGISRYLVSGLALHLAPNQRFPLGTLVVNILGCFLIGILSGLAESRGYFSQHLRLLLITGILGGFTTFSAFGYETIFLVRSGELAMAIINILLSVIFGLLAVWIGLTLASST